MAEILHQIDCNAAPEKIYLALTTREGLQGWWTADTEAEPEIGTLAVFGFFDRSTVFKMRISELIPDKRVHWTCEGDPQEWIDTEVVFDLKPQKEGGTTVHFRHKGWRATEGLYAQCNTTWGTLMFRLKGYVEDRNPGPLFTVSGMTF